MITPSHRRVQSQTALVLAVLLVACLALGGCYKRVVGVQGPGSDSIDVYEPNLKEPVKSPYTDPGAIPDKKYTGK